MARLYILLYPAGAVLPDRTGVLLINTPAARDCSGLGHSNKIRLCRGTPSAQRVVLGALHFYAAPADLHSPSPVLVPGSFL